MRSSSRRSPTPIACSPGNVRTRAVNAIRRADLHAAAADRPRAARAARGPARATRSPPSRRARWWPRRRRVCRRTACRAFRNMRCIFATDAPTATRVPTIVSGKGAAFLVDAGSGLAFPACALAVRESDSPRPRIRCRIRGRDQQPSLRRRRLSPAAGCGRRHGGPGVRQFAGRDGSCRWSAALCSAPIRSRRYFPRRTAAHWSIDLSLSEVARGKVMVAARNGTPIPLGWALDGDGAADDGRAGRAHRFDAADGRQQGRDAGAGRRTARVRAHRRGVRLRGRFVLRRRRQPAAPWDRRFWWSTRTRWRGAEVYLERIETLVAVMVRRSGRAASGRRRDALAAKAERDGVEISPTLAAELARLADG